MLSSTVYMQSFMLSLVVYMQSFMLSLVVYMRSLDRVRSVTKETQLALLKKTCLVICDE